MVKEIRKVYALSLLDRFFLFFYPILCKDYTKKRLDRLMYNNKIFKVKKAPHPKEIIWKNLYSSKSAKNRYRLFSAILTYGLILIAFFCLLFIKRAVM
jgi:hypothetical protein